MELRVEEKAYMYFIVPISIITSLPLTLSVVILSQIKDAKLFAYLNLEIILSLIDCVIIPFGVIVKCRNCFSNLNPFAICVFRFYILNYLSSVSEIATILFGIFAAFSCFCTLQLNQQQSNKISASFLKFNHYIVALIVLFASGLLFSYEFFVPLAHYPPPENTTYDCSWLGNFQNPPFNIFFIGTFFLSYGVLTVVLVIVNIFIIVKLRENLSKNKGILESKAAMKRKTTELKLTKLIIVECCNLIIGRLPSLIFYVAYSVFNLNDADFPYVAICSGVLSLSMNLKFVILFKLNNKFREKSLKLFKACQCWSRTGS